MSLEERTTSATGGQKGVKLARFDLIPTGALTELAEHFGRGARKYDDNQWRKGYEWSKSYASLVRHLNDFWSGKDYDVCSNDPEGCSMVTADGEPYEPIAPDTCYNHTGSHHMAAVAWHSFVLLTFKDEHPSHDDRYRAEVERPLFEFPFGIPYTFLAGLDVGAEQWRDPAPMTQQNLRDVVGYGPDMLRKRRPIKDTPQA